MLTDAIENWYSDWRKFKLRAEEGAAQKMRLNTALRECDIEDIRQMLLNETPD